MCLAPPAAITMFKLTHRNRPSIRETSASIASSRRDSCFSCAIPRATAACRRSRRCPVWRMADAARVAGLNDTHGAAIGHTFTISPTMVNDVRVGFSRQTYSSGVPAYGLHAPTRGSCRCPGITYNPKTAGLTLFQISGVQRIGLPGFFPVYGANMELQYGDTLSMVRGRHSIKTGAQFHRSYFAILQDGDPNGRFRFNGAFTSDFPGDGNGSACGRRACSVSPRKETSPTPSRCITARIPTADSCRMTSRFRPGSPSMQASATTTSRPSTNQTTSRAISTTQRRS